MNFSDLGLRDIFQEQIAPKYIEINMKLGMKFSALNVDFDGSRFKKTCAQGHQKAVSP